MDMGSYFGGIFGSGGNVDSFFGRFPCCTINSNYFIIAEKSYPNSDQYQKSHPHCRQCPCLTGRRRVGNRKGRRHQNFCSVEVPPMLWLGETYLKGCIIWELHNCGSCCCFQFEAPNHSACVYAFPCASTATPAPGWFCPKKIHNLN